MIKTHTVRPHSAFYLENLRSLRKDILKRRSKRSSRCLSAPNFVRFVEKEEKKAEEIKVLSSEEKERLIKLFRMSVKKILLVSKRIL